MYAGDFGDKLFAPATNWTIVQSGVGVDVALLSTLQSFGMVVKTNAIGSKIISGVVQNEIFLPRVDPVDNTIVAVGYQYFGGVTYWNNSAGSPIPNHSSPVKLANSKPRWCLAAESNCRITNPFGYLYLYRLGRGWVYGRRNAQGPPSNSKWDPP